MDGLAVQQRLLDKGSFLPVILVSGFADVPCAVEAIKKGAFDFLEKPVDGELLVAKVHSALARSRQLHTEHLERVTREARLALLTPVITSYSIHYTKLYDVAMLLPWFVSI